MSADSEYCPHCGQKMPAREGYGFGRRKRMSDRIGVAISIGLHLIAVLYYFLKPSEPFHRTPPRGGGEMVYIAPLAPARHKPEKKTDVKPEVAKARPRPQPKHAVAAITPPAAARPKLETYVPPVVAPMQPPPEQDMSELVAKRRAARAAANPQPVEATPESDDERATRIAKANIAGAQGGRSNGRDRDDTGGLFSVSDRTFHGAEVKFRGWNTNFRRNWTQQVHVEVGSAPDLETAIVLKMIEIIRKDHPADFPWESQRLGKVITMSARKQDEPELIAFLLKEMFPEYRRGR